MLTRSARTALGIVVLLLSACGAKTLDFSSSDGGSGAPGTGTGGRGGAGFGGMGGTGGSISTTGTGGTGGTTDASSGGSAGQGGAGGVGTGGSSLDAGGAESGGTDGGSTLPFVTTSFRADPPAKLDLLLTIDNSSSMADKHALLAEAIPELVDLLVNPKCIDPVTLRTVGRAVDGVCAMGGLMFAPVRDIHVGVISTSLGNHGATGICDDSIDALRGRVDPHNDDRGHLLARGADGGTVPTYANRGFLNYNPTLAGAATTAAALTAPFVEMVRAIGQHGCGYEATLESVYRFLVDPNPYDRLENDPTSGGFGLINLVGTDQALLQQRADFLRPDSTVAVLMMTDENDCSIIDGGTGFFALLPPSGGESVLRRGTSACATNPNDICCFNCGLQSAPAGCPSVETDPACQKGPVAESDDPPNLRCFEQKRRYGFDFLYPVSRYINGFSGAQVPNRDGQLVANPLFSNSTCGAGCQPRDPKNVVVAGIVGVPWQRIAINSQDATLGIARAGWLGANNVWAQIVGKPLNPGGPVPPSDPHMVESIQPRPGLASPDSASPSADPIHGHEWDPSQDNQPNADLQYACTFKFATPRKCTTPEDCDCGDPTFASTKKPVCQSDDGTYSMSQTRGKAYPSTRILQVLQELGDQAVIGSICAAQTTDKTRPDYGYLPEINALIDGLEAPLTRECLELALPVDRTTHQTPCHVIEVFEPTTGACNCGSELGRRNADEELLTEEMRAKGSCRCEIVQLSGDAEATCLTKVDATSVNGWCYVDPRQQNGNCDVVRDCAFAQKRLIRFPNRQNEPRAGSTAYLRCDQLPLERPREAVCP